MQLWIFTYKELYLKALKCPIEDLYNTNEYIFKFHWAFFYYICKENIFMKNHAYTFGLSINIWHVDIYVSNKEYVYVMFNVAGVSMDIS